MPLFQAPQPQQASILPQQVAPQTALGGDGGFYPGQVPQPQRPQPMPNPQQPPEPNHGMNALTFHMANFLAGAGRQDVLDIVKKTAPEIAKQMENLARMHTSIMEQHFKQPAQQIPNPTPITGIRG